MHKISIIIPVYNSSKYLDECLKSILSQTYSNLEIICVNDASTDNSLEILESFAQKDSRIKIISYEENKGQGYARNLAIDEATGEYIGFVDSDDTVEINYFEYLLNKSVEHGADISSANVLYVFKNGDIKKGDWLYLFEYDKHILIDIKDKIAAVYRNNHSSPCKHLYKKSFIKKCNIDFVSGYYHEDQYFNVKAFYYANKIVLEKENSPSYNYYVRGGSSMTLSDIDSRYEKSFFDLFFVLNFIIDFLKKENADKVLFDILYKDFTIILTRTLPWIHKSYLFEYAIESINILKDYPELQFKIKDAYENRIINDCSLKVNNCSSKVNWLPSMFGIFNTKDRLTFVIFFINITIKVTQKDIDKMAWWIPIRSLRDKFRAKFN